MESSTLLGLLAGTLTTASFLPQVVKTWKTRHTKDISLYMFLLLVLGICLWVAYGLIKNDIPVVIANVISLALVSTILILKIKHG